MSTSNAHSMKTQLRVVSDEEAVVVKNADRHAGPTAVSDITLLLEARHRDVEDLLVQLDIGEGEAQELWLELQGRLKVELTLWREVVLPLVGSLRDPHLQGAGARLANHRELLTGAISAAGIPCGRAPAARWCQQWEVHHLEEEELLLLPLRRLFSAAVLARAAAAASRICAAMAAAPLASPPNEDAANLLEQEAAAI